MSLRAGLCRPSATLARAYERLLVDAYRKRGRRSVGEGKGLASDNDSPEPVSQALVGRSESVADSGHPATGDDTSGERAPLVSDQYLECDGGGLGRHTLA